VKTSFILGDSKGCCDRCGFDFHQSMLRKEWTGAMVCSPCWEPRHPQDLIKPRAEKNNVKDARPAPAYRYLAVGEITGDDL
jgi:hypothetical protein